MAYRLHFHSVTFGRKEDFMELREIMTCDVEVLSGEASLQEAASKMKSLERWVDPRL